MNHFIYINNLTIKTLYQCFVSILNLLSIASNRMAERIKINRLKVVLIEKDISQKDFAKMVKKTPNTITRICNNENQPSLKFLREMAIALDVEIFDLLYPIKSKK